MRIRVKTAKGMERYGKAPYPKTFPAVTEECEGELSRWYVEVPDLAYMAALVAAASKGHVGAILAPPSHGGDFILDDGDCGLVLTVWDDYLE